MRIQQGEADATVFKAFTDPLAAGYSRARREGLTYKTYPGVDHGGAVKNAKLGPSDATSYIRQPPALTPDGRTV